MQRLVGLVSCVRDQNLGFGTMRRFLGVWGWVVLDMRRNYPIRLIRRCVECGGVPCTIQGAALQEDSSGRSLKGIGCRVITNTPDSRGSHRYSTGNRHVVL